MASIDDASEDSNSPAITWLSGCCAGVTAGAAVSLFPMVLGTFRGLDFWLLFRGVAAVIFGYNAFHGFWPVIVGIAIYTAVSAALGILLAGMISPGMQLGRIMVRGLGLSIVFWFLSTRLLLPLFNPIMQERVVLAAPGWWAAFHIIFGIALGTAPAWQRLWAVLVPPELHNPFDW